MIKILLIIIVPILAFAIYSKRFSNPNKLVFLFGKKGSGKSTYMVKLMLKDIKNGWTVYTNMYDVNIPGVRLFNPDDLKSCRPDKHSSLFIDEAGLEWDNRNYKNFDSGLTEFFKLQRKYECRIVVNSQTYDVDKKIRDLTDSLALQSNIGNVIGITRPIIKKEGLKEATADSESRVAEDLKFASLWNWKITWLPRYFKYFDSFAAPDRPYLSFKEVGKDIMETNVKKAIKINIKS